MAFKAKFGRREDGGYDATYGKGGRKLSAVVSQVGGMWEVVEGVGQGRFKDKKLGVVKGGWAELAATTYGGGPQTAPAPRPPKLPGPPSLRPHRGPPSLAHARGVIPTSFVATERTPEGQMQYAPITFEAEMAAVMANPAIEKAAPDAGGCPSCGRPLAGWREEGGRWLPPCKCNYPYTPEYEPDPFDPRMYERGADNAFRELTPVGALDKVFAWMMQNRVVTDGKLTAPWSDVSAVLYRTTGYAQYRMEQVIT